MFLHQRTTHTVLSIQSLFSIGVLLIICSMTGCAHRKASPANTVSTLQIEDSTEQLKCTPLPPSNTPTMIESPSLEILAQQSDEEDQMIQAQQLVEKMIDMHKYTLSILSEDFRIEHKSYSAFVAYENSIPIEPVIMVDNITHQLHCLSKDGKLTSFLNFPATSSAPVISFLPNGMYEMVNHNGNQKNILKLSQIDNYSFKFSIHAKDTIADTLLSGIGHIEGDYGTFTDEYNHSLIFYQKDKTTYIYDDIGYFSKNNLKLSGNYEFTSTRFGEEDKISLSQAKTLLLSLSMFQTGLPFDINNYHLKPIHSKVIVGDRYCYEFGAYKKYNNNELLTQIFYVSFDGSIIFTRGVSLSNNKISTIIPLDDISY